MDENFVLDRIQELCDRKGLTHYKLALKAGVHQSSLSTLLNRKSTPNVFTLEKICSGLDMTIAQFFSPDGEYINLTKEQKEMVDLFSSLPEIDKELVIAYMQGLIDKRNL
ncbi:MAG: helix-turn-helix transcriptional regulator [Phascolarctobacterium sp.]|nr:helix-turn-helix transcriptional regulator [Phascolarctobacterium sp.]